MRVLVTGPRGGKVDKNLEIYVISATKFFAKELGIEAVRALVHVKIHFRSYLDDSDAELNYTNKRKYNIDICFYNDWLTSLAHEMVHVRQVVNDELSHDILLRNINDHEEYREVFYEKEAFALQYELVKKFTEFRFFDHAIE